MMNVRAIHDEADHAWALDQIAPYFASEPEPGSPEGDRFDVLATLIEAYETKQYDLPDADPVELLQFAIKDLGRSQSELADVLGSKSRASEVLNRQRPLSLEMIRAISKAWHLPVASLVPSYELARAQA